MKFTLKTDKEEIELKQYEVLSARLLDSTRDLLVRYQTELLNDPTVITGNEELIGLLSEVATTEDELQRSSKQVKTLSILSRLADTQAPIGTVAGIDCIINLAIKITDDRQLTTQQKKVLHDVENWKTLDVDIMEVVDYVQFFRLRVSQKGTTT